MEPARRSSSATREPATRIRRRRRRRRRLRSPLQHRPSDRSRHVQCEIVSQWEGTHDQGRGGNRSGNDALTWFFESVREFLEPPARGYFFAPAVTVVYSQKI